MKRIALLGSTGSIGTSTLEVVANHRELFEFDLLVAGSRFESLAEQIRVFRPNTAGLSDENAFKDLRRTLGVSEGSFRWENTELVCGPEAICSAIKSSKADVVVAAVVGMAGLPFVITALEAGKDVALANKESLVVAGKLVVETAKRSGSRLIPVDSEHSAIFQVLQGANRADLISILLTASGGPFLQTPMSEFAAITPERALKHPRWSMGAKITVDSATLMNKALEFIEARWLFELAPEAIEVVIHPQSIIHSMIRLRDGSVLAQLSEPDMKGPIAFALRYPEGRLDRVMKQLDFEALRELTFAPVDHEKFPSIRRARECLAGSSATCAVFNAVNEVAVSEFLNHRLSFPSIFKLIDNCLERFTGAGYTTLQDVEEICRTVTEWARQSVVSSRD